MNEPQYAKVKVIEKVSDDSVLITSSSYRDKLHSYREEIEQSILTSHNTLLNDVIKCLSVIQQHQTPVLTIEIYMDKYGQPERIAQKYITTQKHFGK